MDTFDRTPSSASAKGLFYWLSALLIALAGCATTTPRSPTTTPPSPSATPSSSPAEFPLTLVDDEGTTVTLAAEPARIASLAPSFTEIVFALGAGDRLVGGSDFDDYPPAAVGLPDLASSGGVVIERVVGLAPDLVLAGGNNLTSRGDVVRLRELGFPVLVTYPPTVSAVLEDIRLIARAIGATADAIALTAQIEQRIAGVSAAVAGRERPRVFYELGYQPEIYGPAPDSFVADMVERAGGEPITTTDPAVFSIALESLVTADPEVIVLGDAAYGTCPESVAGRPGWDEMTAVRQNAIRPVDDIVVTRPGPRIGEGLAALALAIDPQAPVTPPAEPKALCQP